MRRHPLKGSEQAVRGGSRSSLTLDVFHAMQMVLRLSWTIGVVSEEAATLTCDIVGLTVLLHRLDGLQRSSEIVRFFALPW